MLVADDDDDILGLVRVRLERDGHTVLTAIDGEQALELARAEKPDLCILDVMMPKASGLEVMRALRADPATAGIPIILLTARAGDGAADAGLAGGAADYVLKPFSPQDIGDRVREQLAR